MTDEQFLGELAFTPADVDCNGVGIKVHDDGYLVTIGDANRILAKKLSREPEVYANRFDARIWKTERSRYQDDPRFEMGVIEPEPIQARLALIKPIERR